MLNLGSPINFPLTHTVSSLVPAHFRLYNHQRVADKNSFKKYFFYKLIIFSERQFPLSFPPIIFLIQYIIINFLGKFAVV